jgi:hypothetical protein
MSDEYLDFDDLDNYVDHLFGNDGYDDDDRPFDSFLSRDEHIDQIINDAFDEVIRWHNQQIAEGADPGSGLHGLPPIPWDERLDGMAAMMGNGNPDDIPPAQSSSSEIIYTHEGKQVSYEVWLVAYLAYLKQQQLQQQEQEKQPTPKPNPFILYVFAIIIPTILALITLLALLAKLLTAF